MTATLEITLSHCGQPMVYARSHVTWEGKPGEGFEVSTTDYGCGECGATVVVSAREPC